MLRPSLLSNHIGGRAARVFAWHHLEDERLSECARPAPSRGQTVAESLSRPLFQLLPAFLGDKHAWLLRVRALGKLELDDGANCYQAG